MGYTAEPVMSIEETPTKTRFNAAVAETFSYNPADERIEACSGRVYYVCLMTLSFGEGVLSFERDYMLEGDSTIIVNTIGKNIGYMIGFLQSDASSLNQYRMTNGDYG